MPSALGIRVSLPWQHTLITHDDPPVTPVSAQSLYRSALTRREFPSIDPSPSWTRPRASASLRTASGI